MNGAGTYNVRVSNAVGTVTSADTTVALSTLSGQSTLSATSVRTTSVRAPSVSATSVSEPIRLSIERSNQSAGVPLRAIAVPGKTYEIQATDILGSTNWITISAVNASRTGEIEFTDPEPANGKAKFYRAISR